MLLPSIRPLPLTRLAEDLILEHRPGKDIVIFSPGAV